MPPDDGAHGERAILEVKVQSLRRSPSSTDGVAMHYIQPGKPDQNAYIERFNRSFESVAKLRALTDAWLRIYNGERPHDSLGRVPPLTFLPRPTTAGRSPIHC